MKEKLRELYSDLTIQFQYSVDSESCTEASLDDIFVELRLQKFNSTKLPETVGYRDVMEIQRRMMISEPIQMSEIFDKLQDRRAPRKVLLLGKAGVGKTTLVKYIANQWACRKLWKGDVKYLFVITLRQLRQERTWTLGDLLLGGLSLDEEEKTAALRHLRKNRKHVMIILEGADECTPIDKTAIERDYSKELELSTLLSSIIDNTMLPGAKIMITSRPNDNIPVCDRTAELYGFPQESVEKYIHKFSAGNTELKKFIKDYLQNNVNIATMCYVPVQCNFVCVCLSDMHSSTHGEDTPSVNTMSQLYVYAVINLARKLHPLMKTIKAQIKAKKIFEVVGNSLKNHAELAKHCTMSTPLRIIIYEADLDNFHICDVARNTGFLAESVKRDQMKSGLKKKCWAFSHLTIQEMLAAVGMLRGPRTELLKLVENETSVRQHEMLIMFVTGLMCDPQCTQFMEHLEPVTHQLDHGAFLKKLAVVFDPLQLFTVIYESQCPHLVKLVPAVVDFSNVFPSEMMSICWVLKQQECRIFKVK